MSNLLSAGLVRLRRSKVFRLSCAVMAAPEALIVLGVWREGLKTGIPGSVDRTCFIFAALLGFLSALVCTFLIGPEYGDGAMRGKLIAGHRRGDVYLANLLLCALASLTLCVAAMIPALALGLSLLGPFRMGAARAAAYIAGTLALSLAYASIFTLLSMLIDNRTVSSVSALVLALLMLVAGTYIYNRLDAPPTVQGYELSVNGQLVESQPMPNPAYIPEGPVREIYKFLDLSLPGGQSIRYCDLSAGNVWAMAACDVAMILITTLTGLALFRRKDLN